MKQFTLVSRSEIHFGPICRLQKYSDDFIYAKFGNNMCKAVDEYFAKSMLYLLFSSPVLSTHQQILLFCEMEIEGSLFVFRENIRFSFKCQKACSVFSPIIEMKPSCLYIKLTKHRGNSGYGNNYPFEWLDKHFVITVQHL